MSEELEGAIRRVLEIWDGGFVRGRYIWEIKEAFEKLREAMEREKVLDKAKE